MNHLKVGTRVFSIISSDEKTIPQYYLLEEKGVVNKIKNSNGIKLVQWKSNAVFGHSEELFLKLSSDRFCYFMAELPDMDQCKDRIWYKVPTSILKAHMTTYKSPWDGFKEPDLNEPLSQGFMEMDIEK